MNRRDLLSVTELGKRLRDLREAIPMGPAEAARQMGIPLATLYRIEDGQSMPSADTLYALSKLYGRTMEQLITP